MPIRPVGSTTHGDAREQAVGRVMEAVREWSERRGGAISAGVRGDRKELHAIESARLRAGAAILAELRAERSRALEEAADLCGALCDDGCLQRITALMDDAP